MTSDARFDEVVNAVAGDAASADDASRPTGITLVTTRPGDALAALAATVAEAKGDDPLAPVIVVVPTNRSGVMARRALGRDQGIAGVDMVTLNRLAELIAGPILAARHLQPISTPLLDLTIRSILEEEPGRFGPIATHPSTIVSLRDVHRELRLAGAEAPSALSRTARGREIVRVSEAISGRLADRWYDEADLLTEATAALTTSGGPGRLADRVVSYLPDDLSALAAGFVRALAAVRQVTVILPVLDDAEADSPTARVADRLHVPPAADRTPLAPGSPSGRATPSPSLDAIDSSEVRPAPAPRGIVSTTDADDEVRQAVRVVIDAARGALTGEAVAFERMTVLWPAERPYARLVEHHLDAAGIPWNGRSGADLTERIAPRLLLDLLQLDQHGLRRSDLFDLLADIPARDGESRFRPTATWERVSRYAGVHRGDDWQRRLRPLAAHERWGEPAAELADFVAQLRESLGWNDAVRSWGDWATWCDGQLDHWFGPQGSPSWSDAEYRAWEALTSTIERLRQLDEIGGPATRASFRAVLDAELTNLPSQHGRVGAGVTVGSLGGAAGLDVDVAVVLGGADGVLPPAPRLDALLSDAQRRAAGLDTSDDWRSRVRQRLLATFDTAYSIVTVPRGDLRATVTNQPSRWLADWMSPESNVSVERVPSHFAGHLATSFPSTPAQHRIATLASTPPVSLDEIADEVLAAGARLVHARSSDRITEYDGDLTDAGVPPIDAGVISPTAIELWATCPYAYFVRHLLHVHPLDEPELVLTIEPSESGTLVHDTLQAFHDDVIDGRLPQPDDHGWSDVHRAALLAHFQERSDRLFARGRVGRPATWAGERDRLAHELTEWLRHDGERAAARGIRVVASEHRFGRAEVAAVRLPLPNGRSLAFEGQVDRVDIAHDGSLVVTDHKTGSDRGYSGLSDDDPTLGGTRFQLPVYAEFARRLAGTPGARVRTEYSFFGRARFARYGFELDPDIERLVADQLGRVAAGIEAGWFPSFPEQPGFRLWIGCRFCEPDGLGIDDRWHDWRRKRHDPRFRPWMSASAEVAP